MSSNSVDDEYCRLVDSGVIPSGAYGFVYMTRNKANGMRYIGQRRFYKGWKAYLGSGILLSRAVNKYGVDSFERNCLCVCFSEEELDEQEKLWIGKYNAAESKQFYNISIGGKSGSFMKGLSDFERGEIYKRVVDSRRKSDNYKSNHRGDGHYKSKAVICVTTNQIFDCVKDAENFYSIHNIAGCYRGERVHSGTLEDGTKLQWAFYDKRDGSFVMPNSLSSRWSRNKVQQYDKSNNLISEYCSAREASNITGVCYSKIIAVCTGTRKTAGGFIWKYKSKEGMVYAKENHYELNHKQ